MNRLLLYIHTLRHLKCSQLFYLVIRRLFPAKRPQAVGHLPTLRLGTVFRQGLEPVRPWKGDDVVVFLNRAKIFPGGRIDWLSADMPKLWRYNLHYFDYAMDRSLSPERKFYLIRDWVERVPAGTQDAWEPYTTSLRIVNWTKLFLSSEESVVPEMLRSLYAQALWLERNLELHLMGNHLLKNGAALVFAGAYFQGPDADRWLTRGLQVLGEQLEEQFLADGGHFERSPMYHAICLIDYLDVMNLLNEFCYPAVRSQANSYRQRICRALDALHNLCLPDGEIPLFNDSAFGVAPEPSAIFEYARRIMSYERPSAGSGLSSNEMPDSGYYMIGNGPDKMVVDCGDVGPAYQPGHAHCDTLSFELAVNGRRMIVDSGVYDYEPGPRRLSVRSTRAHNTVTIDDQEQSEVWGVFRVARRARPLLGKVYQTTEGQVVFEGAHDGYQRLAGSITHKRMITFDGRMWRVDDLIEGYGDHQAKSYVHLHPDFHATVNGQAVTIRDAVGTEWSTLEVHGQAQVALEESFYCPQFGQEFKTTAVVCSIQDRAPFRLSYSIRPNVTVVASST